MDTHDHDNLSPDDFAAGGRAGVLAGGAAIDALTHAILNEKNSPDILSYRGEVVAELQAAVSRQDEAVEDLERNPTAEMRRMVYNLELKRIRYLLRLYLRTRLHKLERMAAYVLANEDLLERLSPAEQRFTQDYFVMAGQHLTHSVLNSLPDGFKDLLKSHPIEELDDLVATPAVDTHVFCSILEDVGSVQLDEDQVVDMKQGDLFIVRYEAVRDLVQTGQAVLV
ncbi:hypothetical protein FOA52_011564 [Chlamydomonas sp. UWO 241]|nr:hypothetical protein FOA52_011564 [Chlamydomonas sp. UWO 241]